jgi:hypothetical protein
MSAFQSLARKSHEPKRSWDFRAVEPLRKRLGRKIEFSRKQTGCGLLPRVCQRCRLWQRNSPATPENAAAFRRVEF